MKYYEFETTEYPISYYLAKEEYLLTKKEESFFIWNNLPGIVIGKNQILKDEVNVKNAMEDGVPIYRRKSGGGAVYADEGCFMFTFISKYDRVDKVYDRCLNKIATALINFGAKVKKGGRNDLLIGDAKVSGNAIYIKGNYAIMHGSILYDADLEKMDRYLTPSASKKKSKGVSSVASRVTNLKKYVRYDKLRLMNELQRRIGTIRGNLFASEQKVIEKLASIYEEKDYLEGSSIPYTLKLTKRFDIGEVTFMAKVNKQVIEEVKITGDFFETYDISVLENSFIGERINRLDDALDKIKIDKFIYGLTNDEFKTLFIKEKKESVKEEKKKDMEVKKTCLYDNHVNHGGKIVEFGGFLMPLEYKDITSEHLAVRNDAGLFDCSHMGEILVEGADTLDYLNYMFTSNIKDAPINKMTYGLLLYENGCVVDDTMIYKVDEEKCMIVVNASNIQKDYDYLVANKGKFNVNLSNLSDECGQLALQGPKAINYLQELTKYDLNNLKLFEFSYFKIDNHFYNVSRSGYTGSDGFEIYGKCADIVSLYEKLLSMGVTPCGLGCRDTLRFEAAMPLYGHEISDKVTPLEAGLNYAIDFNKEDFIGKKALLKQKDDGLTKKLVGLELKDRGIARGDYKLFKGKNEVGYITTGYMIPNSTKVYALGYVDTPYDKNGTELEVQIRNRMARIDVRNKKFMPKEYVR